MYSYYLVRILFLTWLLAFFKIYARGETGPVVLQVWNLAMSPGAYSSSPPFGTRYNMFSENTIHGKYSFRTASPDKNNRKAREQEEVKYTSSFSADKIRHCTLPMSDEKFSHAVEYVKSQAFSNDRLRAASKVSYTGCMTVQQVRKIVQILDTQSTKMTYVTFVYTYTYDPENFYLLRDEFALRSQKEEFDDFLEDK